MIREGLQEVDVVREIIKGLLSHLETVPSPVKEYREADAAFSFPIIAPPGKESFIELVKEFFTQLLSMEDPLKDPLALPSPELHLDPEPRLLKICLIGDGAVGKTSLRREYVGQSFNENYIPTIGADFSHVELDLDGYSGQMTIWDLAGQPKFQSVKAPYFMGSLGAVVVFDITRLSTFFNTFFWIDSLYNYVRGFRPVVFLANKIDLVDQVDPVILGIIDQLIMAFQGFLYERCNVFSCYLKTSAKTGKNVQKAFLEMFRNVLLWLQSRGK